jgi:hypothetical protein
MAAEGGNLLEKDIELPQHFDQLNPFSTRLRFDTPTSIAHVHYSRHLLPGQKFPATRKR